MAVNKNFVVKNGLEVNTNLIFADAATDKVGIANTLPAYRLHVNGGIGATHSYVSGIGTFINGVVVSGATGFNVGAAGSVGIGTNTQNYPFEILGSTGETAAQITGDVNIDGTLTVDSLVGTESYVAISTVTSELYVKDGFGGAVAEVDSLNVSGLSSLTNLLASGISTFSSTNDNALGVTTTGAVQVSGGVGIDKNLTVGSAATIGSSLLVGGKSTFYDYSTVKNTLNINRIQTSTISFGSSVSVSSQETEPREVVFSNDGKTMYVLGNAGNDITYYGLSTSWAVTSASYFGEYSVASQLTSPSGMYFRPDGTKFYVVGTTGVGAAATSVNQYSCSTPWDLTTASYDSVAFSVISQEATPMAVEFKPDGTKFYVVGLSGAAIYQYSCSTPWNVSTASYDSVVYSVSPQETNPQGIRFSPDGLKLLVVGSIKDSISEYNLTTPWDISTVSFGSSITYFSSVGEATPSGLYWKPDGSKLYVSGYGNDRIYEYNITSDADLEVIGETKLYGDAEMHQDVDVYGTFSTYNDAYLKSDLIVSGLTTTNNLYVSGIGTISNVTSNQLSVSGVATIGSLNVGSVSISSGVITATTFQGAVVGIASTAINSDNINISATTSSDTTTSVVLVGNQSTGYQSPFIDSGLTYDANTNNLAATTFTGNLSGNVTGNVTGNADTATYAISSGIATYASVAGVSTYSTSAGIATYASSSGIATYAGSAGIATYATSAGIATALNGTSSVNTTGIITASAFYGDGTNITGVLASPGGSNGQIQYKNGALLGGASNMYYDSGTGFVGIGSTQPTVDLDIFTGNIRGVFKDYGEAYYALGNTGSSKTINLANGNFFTATLTADCTFTFTTGLAAASSAVSFTLFLTNDGYASPGGRVIAWNPSSPPKWPGGSLPSRTTTANRTDVYTFITYDNGATWYGTISMFDYQ